MQPKPKRTQHKAAKPKPAAKPKQPRKVPDEVRAAVRERDNDCCQHCGRPWTDDSHLELHHIIFRSGGGRHIVENLIALCFDHHQGSDGPHKKRAKRRYWEQWAADKYGLDPETWKLVATGKLPTSFGGTT